MLAEYFDNAELKGEPKLRRVEARPYMPSGILDPAVAAAVPARGYSVRWTGTLTRAVHRRLRIGRARRARRDDIPRR